MKLTILSVDIADLGLLYKCVAKNSLGDTDGAIKLYRKFIFIIEHLMYTASIFQRYHILHSYLNRESLDSNFQYFVDKNWNKALRIEC